MIASETKRIACLDGTNIYGSIMIPILNGDKNDDAESVEKILEERRDIHAV